MVFPSSDITYKLPIHIVTQSICVYLHVYVYTVHKCNRLKEGPGKYILSSFILNLY